MTTYPPSLIRLAAEKIAELAAENERLTQDCNMLFDRAAQRLAQIKELQAAIAYNAGKCDCGCDAVKLDNTHRQLRDRQSDLETLVKHAYVVLYVEGMLRSEKEGITFMDAITCELAERGMLTIAGGILDFERLRRGIVVSFEREEAQS